MDAQLPATAPISVGLPASVSEYTQVWPQPQPAPIRGRPPIKRIAVLTSGGDAPGMNAAIRSVVRTGVERDWLVFGVKHGYAGLIADDMALLGRRDVGGIIGQGGTMLGSARSAEFRAEAGRRQALDVLAGRGIDALVVIGGNGSQCGANALAELGFPVVGVAVHHRQRSGWLGNHYRRRYRHEYRAGSDRPAQDHRLLAPPRHF